MEQLLIIDSEKFSYVVNKLRTFFLKKGFIEVHTQNRLSILAACEDPDTIATFHYANNKYPLPQTGQMWLEYELLKNPKNPGYFCVSTSYRNEPNPVPGRHDIIFPMFEFELKGGMDELEEMESELLTYLGFGNNFPGGDYEDVALEYGVEELDNSHELRLRDDHGEVFFLKNFPEKTSPFWNMKRNPRGSNKIDVIIGGMETIGSAERSCDKEEMRRTFETISEGGYAEKLYKEFGKERVLDELEEFLAFDFFPRSGGGIGMTRLIKSMDKLGLISKN